MYRTIFKTTAAAKLTLEFKLEGRADNGRQQISSCSQTVSTDYLASLMPTAKGHESISACDSVSKPVTDALIILARETKMTLPCSIRMRRSLPKKTGMGIKDAHVAAALRLANRAFDLNLSSSKLEDIAGRIGLDVRLLVRGGRCRIDGKNSVDNITSEVFSPLYYVMVTPQITPVPVRKMFELHEQNGLSITEIVCNLYPEAGQLYQITHPNQVEHFVSGKGPTVCWGFNEEWQRADLCRILSSLSMNANIRLAKAISQPDITV